MLLIKEKSKIGYRAITWFADERVLSIERDVDIVEYCQIEKPFCNPDRESSTLINDLTKSENEIFEGFGKNTKYKINRAVREGITLYQYSKEELLNKRTLYKLSEYYVDFLKSKNMEASSVDAYYRNLYRYALNGNLCITSALKDGSTLVVHYYIFDEETVRLLYSASHFRHMDVTTEKNLIGIANRFLHWEDIKYFRKVGLKRYDWGGYSKDPALEGINKFKAGFGGELRNTYYITITTSIKGKLMLMASKIIKGILRKWKVMRA